MPHEGRKFVLRKTEQKTRADTENEKGVGKVIGFQRPVNFVGQNAKGRNRLRSTPVNVDTTRL